MNISYYDLLGLQRDANQGQIRDAHRKLCKLLHPDKVIDASLKSSGETITKLVNQAYDVLKDTRSRRNYDDTLDQPNSPDQRPQVAPVAFPANKRIKIMISSRCESKFPSNGSKLSEVRKRLKASLEKEITLGVCPFEVWINEDAPPDPGDNDSWDACLKAVRDCHVLVVLYNGEAGWAQTGHDIGICHAEFQTGMNFDRSKVVLIDLDGKPVPLNADERGRNERFRQYVLQQSLFRGADVRDETQLGIRVREGIYNVLQHFIDNSIGTSGQFDYSFGEALDWSRLNFLDRQKKMESTLRSALGALSSIDSVIKVNGKTVYFHIHAIPASLTIAAAKELVGQPFLRDHEGIEVLGDASGPVHIIGCLKTVSEAQALKFLGFPDATLVKAPFGVYLADNIQKIQLIFLENCRDDATTRHAFQRFRAWLEQSGEDEYLAKRALARKEIIKKISEQMEPPNKRPGNLVRASAKGR